MASKLGFLIKQLVEIRIEVVKAFVRLRKVLASHKDIAGQLAELRALY